jgi:hypothetical protein
MGGGDTITISPEALDGAGTTVLGTKDQLAGALATLVSSLGGCGGMCGDDPAGILVARSVDEGTKAEIVALVGVVNSIGKIGDGLRLSAANYAKAEHHSKLGSQGEEWPTPTASQSVSAKLPPTSEGGESEPALWKAVESIVGMVWPNGEPGKLRSAAGAWRAMGSACQSAASGLDGPKGVAAEQQIPEGEKVSTAFGKAATALGQAVSQCNQIAGHLDDYAGRIDKVHKALLDLASKLTNLVKTAIDEVKSWFTDEPDVVGQIVSDIKTILSNFLGECQALAEIVGPVIAAAASAMAQTVAAYAQMALQAVEDVAYNVAADVVNAVATLGNAMIQHPEDVISMVAGVGLMVLGAGGEVAGVALDATVIGAAVGVPANVVSAAAIASGAAMAGGGALKLGQDASKDPVTVMESRSGQARNPDGTFAGGRYGKEAEKEGLNNYHERYPSREMITKQQKVQAQTEAGESKATLPDGYAKKPDGTWEILEVKSGSSPLTEGQKALRDQIEREGSADLTVVDDSGNVRTIKATSYHVEEVASEGPAK